jgi:hypothetical protein
LKLAYIQIECDMSFFLAKLDDEIRCRRIGREIPALGINLFQIVIGELSVSFHPDISQKRNVCKSGLLMKNEDEDEDEDQDGMMRRRSLFLSTGSAPIASNMQPRGFSLTPGS